MKIEHKDGYTLFTTDENILQEALDTFFSSAEKHSTENIFFEISDNLNITPRIYVIFEYRLCKKRKWDFIYSHHKIV